MKKRLKITGIILMLIALGLSIYMSYPTMNGEDVSFVSSYKNEEVELKGTYYKTVNGYVVIICPGYSCDRTKWRPVADMLKTDGYGVLLFDYSGQGASKGKIGFDNAKTDDIPRQIDDAIEFINNTYDIPYEKIILLAHSMGGRAVLRLLYDYNNKNAITEIKRKEIPLAILLSPEVNYNYNAQASLFAGTSDSNEDPWKNYCVKDKGNTKIYLFGSYNDDIVSSFDVEQIAKRINEEAVIENGVLHSYMMYSPKIMKLIEKALYEFTGIKNIYNINISRLNYPIWVMALLGLYFYINNSYEKKNNTTIKISDETKFIRSKLLMWIPGFIVSIIVCSICVVVPFGSPVMNLPYMNFICGYGIVMAIAYRFKIIKGIEYNVENLNIIINYKCILEVMMIFVYVIMILRTNMYRLIPVNYRLFWLIFCSLLMSVGYYVSSKETDMIDNKKMLIIYNIIQYIPLFLLVGFYLILKSYSGMIGQLQNMIFMYMVCVPLNNYIRNNTNSRILGALLSSLLFQMFMITSAALIAIF